MKPVKIVAGLLIAYVGIVAAFESLIGYFQPAGETTLVISTRADGTWNDRVLARLESDEKLYVAVNHWPRAWYNQLLEDPNVAITLVDEKADYLAVPVTGPEHDRVESENRAPLAFRVLTGFPPRYFVRLDPR